MGCISSKPKKDENEEEFVPVDVGLPKRSQGGRVNSEAPADASNVSRVNQGPEQASSDAKPPKEDIAVQQTPRSTVSNELLRAGFSYRLRIESLKLGDAVNEACLYQLLYQLCERSWHCSRRHYISVCLPPSSFPTAGGCARHPTQVSIPNIAVQS